MGNLLVSLYCVGSLLSGISCFMLALSNKKRQNLEDRKRNAELEYRSLIYKVFSIIKNRPGISAASIEINYFPYEALTWKRIDSILSALPEDWVNKESSKSCPGIKRYTLKHIPSKIEFELIWDSKECDFRVAYIEVFS